MDRGDLEHPNGHSLLAPDRSKTVIHFSLFPDRLFRLPDVPDQPDEAVVDAEGVGQLSRPFDFLVPDIDQQFGVDSLRRAHPFRLRFDAHDVTLRRQGTGTVRPVPEGGQRRRKGPHRADAAPDSGAQIPAQLDHRLRLCVGHFQPSDICFVRGRARLLLDAQGPFIRRFRPTLPAQSIPFENVESFARISLHFIRHRFDGHALLPARLFRLFRLFRRKGMVADVVGGSGRPAGRHARPFRLVQHGRGQFAATRNPSVVFALGRQFARHVQRAGPGRPLFDVQGRLDAGRRSGPSQTGIVRFGRIAGGFVRRPAGRIVFDSASGAAIPGAAPRSARFAPRPSVGQRTRTGGGHCPVGLAGRQRRRNPLLRIRPPGRNLRDSAVDPPELHPADTSGRWIVRLLRPDVHAARLFAGHSAQRIHFCRNAPECENSRFGRNRADGSVGSTSERIHRRWCQWTSAGRFARHGPAAGRLAGSVPELSAFVDGRSAGFQRFRPTRRRWKRRIDERMDEIEIETNGAGRLPIENSVNYFPFFNQNKQIFFPIFFNN